MLVLVVALILCYEVSFDFPPLALPPPFVSSTVVGVERASRNLKANLVAWRIRGEEKRGFENSGN